MTIDGCKSIVYAAKREVDAGILGLGENLMAKEAKFHKICRSNYVRQDKDEHLQTCKKKIHSEAFQTFINFIDSELIKKKNPCWPTVIFTLYKEEFLGHGGTYDDINKYTVQFLMTKVKDHLKDIGVERQANKS